MTKGAEAAFFGCTKAQTLFFFECVKSAEAIFLNVQRGKGYFLCAKGAVAIGRRIISKT